MGWMLDRGLCRGEMKREECGKERTTRNNVADDRDGDVSTHS